MGANLNGFDARNEEPMGSFEAIPAGKYVAAIVASQMKSTKAGDGQYLELQFQVIDGEHKGRLLWARLNLTNTSEVAAKIARSELAAICQAIGVLTPNDSTELHDLPLQVTVAVKKRQDTGDLTNEIKAYAKKPSAVAAGADQAAGDTPPWRRGQ